MPGRYLQNLLVSCSTSLPKADHSHNQATVHLPARARGPACTCAGLAGTGVLGSEETISLHFLLSGPSRIISGVLYFPLTCSNSCTWGRHTTASQTWQPAAEQQQASPIQGCSYTHHPSWHALLGSRCHCPALLLCKLPASAAPPASVLPAHGSRHHTPTESLLSPAGPLLPCWLCRRKGETLSVGGRRAACE